MRSSGERYGLPLVSTLCLVLASAPAGAAGGERLYVDEGCQVCHGGMGLGGVGPQFVNDPFLAFSDYVVGRILVGGGEMPAFHDKMSNAEIAAVANYVRQNWGAKSGKVSPNEVASYRKQFVPGPSVKSTEQDVGPPP